MFLFCVCFVRKVEVGSGEWWAGIYFFRFFEYPCCQNRPIGVLALFNEEMYRVTKFIVGR